MGEVLQYERINWKFQRICVEKCIAERREDNPPPPSHTEILKNCQQRSEVLVSTFFYFSTEKCVLDETFFDSHIFMVI